MLSSDALVVSSRRKPVDPRIEEVRKSIDENPTIDVPALAAKLHLSRSRLDELFRVHLGLSVGRYSRKRRLELGAHLLKSSEMGMKEIIDHVGYKHFSSFVRGFQQHFGITPAKYRQAARKRRKRKDGP
jgi:transcriptional regulator GlxA family with amidase domain